MERRFEFVVTVYTKKGRPIVVDNLYCKKCFSDSESESEAEDKSQTEHNPSSTEGTAASPSPNPEPNDESHQNQSAEGVAPACATDIQLSVVSDSSKSDVSKLLLPDAAGQEKPLRYKLDVMMDRSTTFLEFIISLNWLHFTIMKKDSIRLLIPIIGMVVWLGIVIIYSSIAGMFSATQCDDGSFASFYSCIDNMNPPSWRISSDSPFVENCIE